MKLDFKKVIWAIILLLVWEVFVLKMHWTNDTAGRYLYFTNLIIIVVFQVVALRDFNAKFKNATGKDRFIQVLIFNLLLTLGYVIITGILFQWVFTAEIQSAIKEKLDLLEQARTSMTNKSYAEQNILIDSEMKLIEKMFTWNGIFIFKGAITFFQSTLVGGILAFSMNGKKLFE
jgi:hypothetical protein